MICCWHFASRTLRLFTSLHLFFARSVWLAAVFQFFPRPEKREAYEKCAARNLIFFIYALPFRGKNYEKRTEKKGKIMQGSGPTGGEEGRGKWAAKKRNI